MFLSRASRRALVTPTRAQESRREFRGFLGGAKANYLSRASIGISGTRELTPTTSSHTFSTARGD